MFHQKWKKFLFENEIEEATAAKKRGIELPTILDELKKYSKPSTQIPTHYITFSDVNKVGINPKSPYGTPLGIYTYPVNDVILDQLSQGKIPFASERKFIHLITPREGSKILHTVPSDSPSDEYFNAGDFRDAVLELYRPAIINKFTKRTPRYNSEGEYDSTLVEVPKLFQSYEKFKKSIERGQVENPGGAAVDLKHILSNEDEEYFLESQYSDPEIKDSIEEIKKYFDYPPKQGAYDRRDYFTKMMRQVIHRTVRGEFDGSQEAVDKVHKFLRLDPADDSLIDISSYDDEYPNFIKQPGFNTKHARAILAAWDFLKKIAQKKQQEQQSDWAATGRIITAVWGYFTGEEWKKLKGIRSGKLGNYDIIRRSPEFKKVEEGALNRTWLGILWSLAREVAGKDSKKWGTVFRFMGIDGVSDGNGQGLIHDAEPMQAVFFSRYAIDHVKTYDNKMAAHKVFRRERHKYTRESMPIIKKAFEELIGRRPNKQEVETIYDQISTNIKNMGEKIDNIPEYLQNQYQQGKLGGYSTKRLFAVAIYEDKKESLIKFVYTLDAELARVAALDDIADIFLGGADRTKPIDSETGQDWNSTQAKLNFEFENEGLRTGQEASEVSLKALKQWFLETRKNFNATIKKDFNVEFPFKEL